MTASVTPVATRPVVAHTAIAPQATISIGRPGLQVALTGDADAAFPIVVRQSNLRDAQRKRWVLRAGNHDPVNFVVALEIEAAIAPHPASARASARPVEAGEAETVRYVGTPEGLVTLIKDIYAAEVADAVIITPLDGSATAARVREEVLPLLRDQRRRVA
ncbi:hypothetical protein [Gordonia soli]|uniref:Luciferase-like domain-containing protein n=1 Tax=Gordonia soli NBRC 108243 TaxID=1223545 RepID=M0QHL7_9ACTN|nr:hypothetical protein [Gordonia soli]GAC68140.1 hypothetical protein GS4_11_04120 [Gordonia soli NBRC 108243]